MAPQTQKLKPFVLPDPKPRPAEKLSKPLLDQKFFVQQKKGVDVAIADKLKKITLKGALKASVPLFAYILGEVLPIGLASGIVDLLSSLF